jgi:demethylmenaquinone methyltransferase/2-methoxy-6-polyprenyl-1,4-benzoquinol methylase
MAVKPSEKTIIPYKNSAETKKSQIAEMFDNIAHKYDFLNHFLSLNIDKIWRRKAINLLKYSNPKLILDVASGTGDLALEAARILKPQHIVGIDISEGMLAVGRKKIDKKNLTKIIQLQTGDSENIEFSENHFDAVMAAFGVRNFENLEKGLSEMYRVLKPGGEIVILEFSRPQKFPIKQLYHLYFFKILPSLGKIFSKDMSAYTYLPESVYQFPYGKEFCEILTKIGFAKVNYQSVAMGIAAIYFAKK